ncbi:FAD-dependent oxidoreductase [Cellulosilyticum sp. I15G10I2]|uniref:FAD-dependent oxidoreductase n=1 Tax=Cellulosilyticum sp. I15G10I2 TaxID=1892843 RepID=UPI00085CB13C|nr:FAD-dependent oxidoreductase [Cellulosilyticum sp. I15G10I2]
MKKVIIVGGVATGASAAARLRRLDENIEIIMFEKGDYISFANCGLPYYIGDIIEERDKLLVATPKLMKDRFKIDVRVNSEVVALDVTSKKVTISSKERGIYDETFDALVLAPGAKPLMPNIPGIKGERIFTLRNIKDTDRIKSAVSTVKSAIVIGGGYIGVEMAENLRHNHIDVTLVEAASHILMPFDEDIVVMAEKEMEDQGVRLILNDGVKAFRELSDGIEVELQSNKRIKADIIISAMGVVPDTSFLQDTGIILGVKGHILVNEHMETNIKGIYAGGDAVEVIDFVNGMHRAIPLAGPANKHGRIIADNISGLETIYKNTQGTAVIKVFDLTLAATGNNESILERSDTSYQAIIIHPNNHAGYYPGASPITLKLIFDNTGKILGAQALGYEGVEKRIDVIATVIRFKGTVYDLTELELSYAPPFGSAKDPVNFAGYVAENVLTGKSDIVHPKALKEIKDDGNIVILDVRTHAERVRGKVEGSVAINVNELRDQLDQLDRDKEYWIHCAVGLRAYVAERILKQAGFKCKNITGGYKTIQAMAFKPQHNQ